MSEERRMILQMLQEGKLTVEEAERLLTALEGDGEPRARVAHDTYEAETTSEDRGAWHELVAELRRLEAEMRRVKEEFRGVGADACSEARHFRTLAREEARRAREKAREELGRVRRRLFVRVRGENFGCWD